jgi:ubiquinone/menaquinone biosynthesis C-methylase UbiE
MQIASNPIHITCTEADVYNSIFDFEGKRVLELGCGSAAHARKIAEANPTCQIDALEVDKIQHEKNIKGDAPANIFFKEAGAQDIPADDNSYDIIFMFKSLHHVPIELMDQALQEIQRVLKPGGMAYISEPIYAGDFNEVMRIFHDEKEVREHAFAAVTRAVETGLLKLDDQLFFNTERRVESFETFQAEIINRTFVEHKLDDETWEKVKVKFEQKMTGKGAIFLQPHRVDLLAYN